MITPVPIDCAEVLSRGLRDAESLTQEERLVYLVMHLEACADMEGWDHFFTSDAFHYYPEVKAGLADAGDLESLEVLNHYEHYLAERGVRLEADAIGVFLSAQGAAELESDRDWRTDFSLLASARWQKLSAQLLRHGLVIT